jgi:hypothetical protein
MSAAAFFAVIVTMMISLLSGCGENTSAMPVSATTSTPVSSTTLTSLDGRAQVTPSKAVASVTLSFGNHSTSSVANATVSGGGGGGGSIPTTTTYDKVKNFVNVYEIQIREQTDFGSRDKYYFQAQAVNGEIPLTGIEVGNNYFIDVYGVIENQNHRLSPFFGRVENLAITTGTNNLSVHMSMRYFEVPVRVSGFPGDYGRFADSMENQYYTNITATDVNGYESNPGDYGTYLDSDGYIHFTASLDYYPATVKMSYTTTDMNLVPHHQTVAVDVMSVLDEVLRTGFWTITYVPPTTGDVSIGLEYGVEIPTSRIANMIASSGGYVYYSFDGPFVTTEYWLRYTLEIRYMAEDGSQKVGTAKVGGSDSYATIKWADGYPPNWNDVNAIVSIKLL